MMNNVAILADRESSNRSSINWGKIGRTISELGELYQLVKEQNVDLVLVESSRMEMNRSVAARIRRPNGLTEIWEIAPGRFGGDELEPYFDGSISTNLGQAGIAKKVKMILADKKLLDQYSITGRSPQLKNLVRTIDRVAPTDVSVLIVGPSGAGKEIAARAVHIGSSRRDKPFVAINCGALAEGILESELFGHEKGAFTGSVSKREGLFQKAEGGTIFLDEIGETSPNMQVKLLRVLEDGVFYPVGSSSSKRANVRVVAATNRDLTEAIAGGKFREDLYFRIATVKLVVPPLLERKGDIQPLLQHFWRDEPEMDFSLSALERLMQYDWPGNVRQLRNFAARMVALKPDSLVDAGDVDGFVSEQQAGARNLPVSTGKTVEEAGQELIYRAILSLGNEVRLLRDLITSHLPSESDFQVSPAHQTAVQPGSSMEQMEEALIRQVLDETGGNRKETARRLGIGERTLYRKLTKYNLK